MIKRLVAMFLIIPATLLLLSFQGKSGGLVPSPTAGTKPTPTKPGNATVIFTFDDGSVSDYLLAYPILEQYGIKGTSYLNTKAIDERYPGRMNWTQIKQMHADGWSFGCHSFEHNRMEDMTDAQIKHSMEMVDQSFVRQGLKAPEITAYPYGCYNTRVIDGIKAFRKQARLANNLTTNFVDLNHLNPYAVESITADMQTVDELHKLKLLVDKAYEQKTIIVFFVHSLYARQPFDTVMCNDKIPFGSYPQTDSGLFAQLVDYCVKKGCSFMTMEQLMDMHT